MRRVLAFAVLMLMALTPLLWFKEAAARREGNSSSSRGSRTHVDSPRSSSPRWSSNESAGSSSWFSPGRNGHPRGWVSKIGGLIAGGVLGSLLLGGSWHGGLSLLDVFVLSGLIYLMFRGLVGANAGALGAVSVTDGVPAAASNGARSLSGAILEGPMSRTETRRASRIHDIEPDFDARRFGEMVVAVFAKLQRAWTARDASSITDLLTPNMKAYFEDDCHRMRADGRINRFEQVQIRRAQITEAWQEQEHDHVVVYLGGTAIDYTMDERGIVVDGNPAEPVTFEEALTFIRPCGSSRWWLAAIRQQT
jgi:predicted lipid-binding transport protein (Tim44 family)